MRLIALFVLCVGLCSSVSAYDGFKCTVKAVSKLQDDGTHSDDSVMTSLGEEFVVDRVTGRMVGGLSNHSIGGQPKVIDPGSADQSFKALTIFGPYVSINYLEVQVYANSYEKPFSFIEFGSFITGLCEPY